ncbi:MAG: NTP transferase domain-containing protein [Solobacterium sp.]|nr:NTP transferase domain-containing protein [Solobacterium sp.]
MNKMVLDLLNILSKKEYKNQRELVVDSGYSLGTVNQSLNTLKEEGLVDHLQLTEKGTLLLEKCRPERAVILAAGMGMRMIPINSETPKALVEVNGQPLIERMIQQLHEVNIHEIYIVVGFMKESFEYLMDEYGVELVVNMEYVHKNNLHSLALTKKHLNHCYVIPGDMYCENNPFRTHEMYSWYMVSDEISKKSCVRVNRKQELVLSDKGGNRMIGISYIHEENGLLKRLAKMDADERYDNAFWEDALYVEDRMCVYGRVVSSATVTEIDTYEQLREWDSQSSQLKGDAILVASQALHAEPDDIVNVEVLKKGMTNRSFMFTCREQKYIMRIPGEGTGQLINRKQEADVYSVIHDKGLCDDIIYINPENGYKITKYIDNARVCDPFNEEDVKKCMKKLKEFHQMHLSVDHEFKIFDLIDFYESLWNGQKSIYRDYEKTKENVLSLQSYINSIEKEYCLTHIDAVPDNFLITDRDIRLIDWEYAGMQDPHVDLAMFCIYAMYDREHVEKLIDAYFDGDCSKENRIKIYCYIAACGLLWSNWCEYKLHLGVEFGEYSLRQYRFGKEYYRIAKEEMEKL